MGKSDLVVWGLFIVVAAALALYFFGKETLGLLSFKPASPAPPPSKPVILPPEPILIAQPMPHPAPPPPAPVTPLPDDDPVLRIITPEPVNPLDQLLSQPSFVPPVNLKDMLIAAGHDPSVAARSIEEATGGDGSVNTRVLLETLSRLKPATFTNPALAALTTPEAMRQAAAYAGFTEEALSEYLSHWRSAQSVYGYVDKANPVVPFGWGLEASRRAAAALEKFGFI